MTVAVQEEEKRMYPTPATRDWKDSTKKIQPSVGKTRGESLVNRLVKEKKNLGGKLNPNFVEFLMGFQQNYTKIESTELNHLETQLCHKSQQKSEKQ